MDSDQTEVDIKIDGPSENGIDADSGPRVMDGGVSGLAKNLRGIPYFYRQDVVRHKKSGSIGIVNNVAGDSDSDSSTDDYDDDDEEEEEGGGIEDEGGDGGHLNNGDKNANEKKGGERAKTENLEVGQVRVLWLDDTEEIQHANDIMLLDRGFLHGDYVASASDPTGQVGVVQDVNISVDLLAPDGSIVKGVLSRDLKRVREFVVGDYVVLGPWLGRVDDVLDNVTVLIDDGSSCKVVGADPLHLKPVSTHNLEEDGQFPYYPGQRVRASSSSVFKNSRWLSGFWKANRLEGTVTKVTVGSVFIYWIASAGYGPDSAAAPSEKQSPKNLKLLSCFAHANWQVGDWCLLTPVLRSSSIILEKNLYKLGLQNSTTSETQRKNGCESEETPQEQLDEVKEPMDVDQVASTNENGSQSNSRDPVQNSTTSETQQENGCESEDTPHEELGEVKEPMDVDQVASTSENGSQSNSRDPVHETWPLYRKKMRRVFIRKDKKARKKEENFEKSFMIINSSTKVDVAWQDGTVGHGMDSKLLVPIDSPGDHEFVAEQYVVEKASDDIVNISETRRCGVIQSVNAKERTACVRWLKPVERPEDPREFDTQEIVSVYELEGHPDYDYTYGDVVVRLSPVSVPTSAISNGDSDVESRQQIEDGDDPNTEEHDSSKIGDNPSGEASTLLDLSWVGNITDLKNGDIEVTWADGMVSTVGPQAIFVVGRDDDDDDNDSIANGSEVSHGAASWETVEDDDDDEMDALENAQEEAGSAKSSYRDSEGGGSNSGRNSALSLPLAAIDFVTRLASGIFSRRKNVDESFSDSQGEGELQDQDTTYISDERDSSDDSISQKSIITDYYNAESTHGKGEESADDEAPATSNISEGSCNVETERVDGALFSDDNTPHFKRFDTAKDPLDHYFIGSSGQINSGRKWLKKVQQDWSILQNNLPDDIYVRVYEDRMDLIRAAIVGPYGTPYQDGLFFFDFFLPPEYPDVPPTAHYHSGGWRINPNLYEEGKVCLSLLNTWSGRGNEVWDPKSSSILQVLVSLQGLVLNSRPYFNEAGYDKQAGTAEGEKNSLSYNENAFLLNCKTMMYLMRRPPKDFEELIGYHFKRRGWYILKACDAYMKGNLIGSLSRDAASAGMEEKSNMTSVGFKLMLAKILPKLYSALSDVGCDCAEFKHLVPGDNKIEGDCFISSLTLSQI